MKNWFILHQDVIAIKGMYDQGILCSIIKLKDRSTILVKGSPEEVIRDTIHYFRFYFTDDKFFQVRRGSRDLCPVEVNPIHNMCFFLHTTSKSNCPIWFNVAHIEKTTPFGQRTKIHFSNGETKLVDSVIGQFNKKMYAALICKTTDSLFVK
jgi:hypothetical protein